MAGSNRNIVEECLTIDISWLARHDYFCGIRSGRVEWKRPWGEVVGSMDIEVRVLEDLCVQHVRFQYTCIDYRTREKNQLDYKVELVSTACNFGGQRYWFVCPLVFNNKVCGRRVGKLYLPPGSKYFGCRSCYNLTYQSCKEHDKRVDSLAKLPDHDLLGMMTGRNQSQALLAIKASMKALRLR